MSEIEIVKEAEPVQALVAPAKKPIRKPRVAKKAAISESSTDEEIDYDVVIQCYRENIDKVQAANFALLLKLKHQDALLDYYRADVDRFKYEERNKRQKMHVEKTKTAHYEPQDKELYW